MRSLSCWCSDGVRSAAVFYSSSFTVSFKVQSIKAIRVVVERFRTSSPVSRPVNILTNMEDLTVDFLHFPVFFG